MEKSTLLNMVANDLLVLCDVSSCKLYDHSTLAEAMDVGWVRRKTNGEYVITDAGRIALRERDWRIALTEIQKHRNLVRKINWTPEQCRKVIKEIHDAGMIAASGDDLYYFDLTDVGVSFLEK